MGKNKFLEDREKREQAILDAGQESGAQRIIDYLQCVLHDPKVMGKDVFGPGRLQTVVDAIRERDRHYAPAYTVRVDADKYQEELDTELRAIWKDKLVPFAKRQPYILQPGYQKARKGWK